MFWKKKQIIPPKIITKKTLEEVGNDKSPDQLPYFRVMGKQLLLYLKSPIGAKEVRFKLPLRPTDIVLISTRCRGNKDFWEREIVRSLNRHWGKYGLS